MEEAERIVAGGHGGMRRMGCRSVCVDEGAWMQCGLWTSDAHRRTEGDGLKQQGFVVRRFSDENDKRN